LNNFIKRIISKRSRTNELEWMSYFVMKSIINKDTTGISYIYGICNDNICCIEDIEDTDRIFYNSILRIIFALIIPIYTYLLLFHMDWETIRDDIIEFIAMIMFFGLVVIYQYNEKLKYAKRNY
jgi:hypothetical protein